MSLIVFSSVLDYWIGFRIYNSASAATKRRWLIVSLVANLGLLAIFKYTPFIVENFEAVLGASVLKANWDLSTWVVPVGISFYTFQTLSYSIDIYRGQLKPAKSLRDFMLYVAFFPQLVAGPIVRAKTLLPQFRRRRALSYPVVQAGLYHVIVGLFLKIVVADNLAPIVEHGFDKAVLMDLSPVSAWLTVLYFSIQIFADFAGYSGIAIGLAYLMGLHFPVNFRSPYISRSLSEFWTRWHISLSQWLRDYLYISVGGNRKGRRRTYLSLMITMLLGGLWHGAAWTFVAWGALHGLGLCIERAFRRKPGAAKTAAHPLGLSELLSRFVQIAIVFVFVLTTWVFFRATDFSMAWMMLERMYVAPFTGPLGIEAFTEARHLILVLPVIALHLGQLAKEWFDLRPNNYVRALVAALFLFLLTIIQRDAPAEFIYFQF